ncbi:MAG: HEAT repeat domain-containing protein [Candidatus Riflebacteria bacterium]|nr:HEAT repeat domain-containing protein [Candidatus Riflebacteria bacterium]
MSHRSVLCFFASFLLVLISSTDFPVEGAKNKKKYPKQEQVQENGQNVLASEATVVDSHQNSNSAGIRLVATSGVDFSEIQKLLEANSESEAFNKTQQLLASDTSFQTRLIVADLFTSQALKLKEEGAVSSSPEINQKVMKLFLQAREIDPESIDRWRYILDQLISTQASESTILSEADNFLLKNGEKFRNSPPENWKGIFEKLESLSSKYQMDLQDLQILEILASYSSTNELIRSKAQLFRQKFLTKEQEYVNQIKFRIDHGELDEAEKLLLRLKQLDPNAPTQKYEERLKQSRQIQKLLFNAFNSFNSGNFEQSISISREVLKIDPENSSAKEYIKRAEEKKGLTSGAVKSEVDQLTKFKRELNTQLLHAEKTEDLSEIRKILKELETEGLATVEQQQQLKEVENEIFKSRIKTEERWAEAQKEFKENDWKTLLSILNHNPQFGESPDRIAIQWEMKLMCNSFLHLKEEQELLESANKLQELCPKSFWVHFLRLKIAMDKGDYKEAAKLYPLAAEIDSSNPALVNYRRIIWLQENGWKFIPFLALLFFYLLGKYIPFLFDWYENLIWALLAWMSPRFPRVSLQLLEKKFGSVKEGENRIKLFELLVVSAFRSGQTVKAQRYSEVLQELSPANPIGIKENGYYLLSTPNPDLSKLPALIEFLLLEPTNKKALEKIGKLIIQNKFFSPEALKLLKLYIASFPEDKECLLYFGEMYRSTNPAKVGREGLELMEKAFRINKDESLGTAIFSVQLGCGLIDRATDFVIENIKDGKLFPAIPLLDTLESEIDSEVSQIKISLEEMDHAKILESLSNVADFRYLNRTQFNDLLESIEPLIREDDSTIRYKAQKIRDHIREVINKSDGFREKIVELTKQPHHQALDQNRNPEKSVSTPSAKENVSEDSADSSTVKKSGTALEKEGPPPSTQGMIFTDEVSESSYDLEPVPNVFTNDAYQKQEESPAITQEEIIESNKNATSTPSEILSQSQAIPEISAVPATPAISATPPARSTQVVSTIPAASTLSENSSDSEELPEDLPPFPFFTTPPKSENTLFSDLDSFENQPVIDPAIERKFEYYEKMKEESPIFSDLSQPSQTKKESMGKVMEQKMNSDFTQELAKTALKIDHLDKEKNASPLKSIENKDGLVLIDLSEITPGSNEGKNGAKKESAKISDQPKGENISILDYLPLPEINTKKPSEAQPPANSAEAKERNRIESRLAEISLKEMKDDTESLNEVNNLTVEPDKFTETPIDLDITPDDSVPALTPANATPTDSIVAPFSISGLLPDVLEKAANEKKSHREKLSTTNAPLESEISSLGASPNCALIDELVSRSTGEDIPAWVNYLNSSISLTTLQYLIRKIGMIKSPKLTPHLLEFVSHPVQRVKANLIEGLEENHDPSIIPVLTGFLNDSDNRIRANAIKALKSFGFNSILDEIKKMVNDSRPNMRDSAIFILKDIQTQESSSMLEKLLYDSDPFIRKNAIKAMANQGLQGNIPILKQYLHVTNSTEEKELLEKAIDFLTKKK